MPRRLSRLGDLFLALTLCDNERLRGEWEADRCDGSVCV
jgi:hypothetical protein